MQIRTLFISLLFFLQFLPFCLADIQLYLSPNGSDTKGTGNRTSPWKSIEKARDYISSKKNSWPKTSKIFINLRAGLYPIDKTIFFGEKDSGTATQPISYRSIDGIGKAIITLSQNPSIWKPNSRGISKFKFEADISAPWTISEKGIPCTSARYPNEDYLELCESAVYGPNKNQLTWKKGVTVPKFSTQHAYLELWIGWWRHVFKVEQVDYSQRTIYLNKAISWEIDPSVTLPKHSDSVRFFIFNAPELIDAPGEFYLDPKTKSGQIKTKSRYVRKTDITIPSNNEIMMLNNAQHITFDGLRFIQTGRTYDFVAQEKFNRRGIDYSAIRIFRSENIIVQNCNIEQSYTGVALDKTINCLVKNNWIHHGNDPIFSVGIFSRNSENLKIENNLVNNTANGIMISKCQKSIITQNTVHTINRSGIWYFKSRNGVIDNNDISRIGLTGADTSRAGIYANMSSRDCTNVISNNYIHDIEHNEYLGFEGAAIYLDQDGCFDYTITNNCINNINGLWAIWAQGSGHEINNNIIANVYFDALSININDSEGWYGNEGIIVRENYKVVNNIFYNIKGAAFNIPWQRNNNTFESHIKKTFKEFNNNLYYNTSNGNYTMVYDISFKEWQKLGFDKKVVLKKDPLFTSINKNNYSLKSSSPALKLGIKSINLKAGVTLNNKYFKP